MDCSSWDGWLDLGVACGLDSQFDGLGADIGASDNSNFDPALTEAAILYTTPVVDEQHELKQAVDFSDAGIFLADDGLLHDDPGHAVDWSLIGSLSETRAVEVRTVPSHEEIEERLAYEPAPGGGDADMYATDQIEATGLPSAVPAGGSRPATARKGQQRWMRTTRIIQEYRRQVLHNHELEEVLEAQLSQDFTEGLDGLYETDEPTERKFAKNTLHNMFRRAQLIPEIEGAWREAFEGRLRFMYEG
ncbi:hypothetical protein GUITHDRAFT_160387 [Guillardia theta CCMP2712]|uniref:Uncharacterized protein n=1 Tax=Guillardia theta (strain CCMP2712) TaxID=905079 RepID=L1K3U6_GUITC|nr:hypothetical protein GUITHDRAFT_160387 [Guillardia theta CCMP2712]EKX55145.1 hypothetical protein GUITHDRAFT_160387 [Guillardia theta CCMP2712]|eukprot:XP_005842125.1 hypothetical protein GUITHDRAFT_160387 [Guillardia theta CCMP2712]